MPGVVFKTAFKKKWNVGGFLFYMNRPDAFKGKLVSRKSEFYDYIEYMRNTEKSDGLFTASCDHVDEKGIEQLKEMERISCDKILQNGLALYHLITTICAAMVLSWATHSTLNILKIVPA